MSICSPATEKRTGPTGAENSLALLIYQDLMVRSKGLPNDAPLACMLATWLTGGGALPDAMGLSPEDFQHMLAYHFPSTPTPQVQRGGLDPSRAGEAREIRTLLLSHRAGHDPSEAWMASIVTAGCMGNDHLWQDLGLWSRRPLTELMRRNFPTLAAQNLKNMKWKRFLYKQLCVAEGLSACRSPSCGICVDYPACFGPEY